MFWVSNGWVQARNFLKKDIPGRKRSLQAWELLCQKTIFFWTFIRVFWTRKSFRQFQFSKQKPLQWLQTYAEILDMSGPYIYIHYLRWSNYCSILDHLIQILTLTSWIRISMWNTTAYMYCRCIGGHCRYRMYRWCNCPKQEIGVLRNIPTLYVFKKSFPIMYPCLTLEFLNSEDRF